MSLSAKVARALEQVKMVSFPMSSHIPRLCHSDEIQGLYILYGAAYYTEEEMVKIDGLIHKGQYVITRGPQSNLLEEELMSFDDANEKTGFHFHDQSFETIKEGTATVTETSIPSTASSEPAESTDYPPETPPNGTSAEASSDDEAALAKSSPLFEFAEIAPAPTVEAKIPNREPKEIPVAGGLALGYTKAQLDEVRAFNAGLTRAGQKSRLKYEKVDETTYSDSASHESIKEEQYPSPTPTEHETRIQSWASEVNSSKPEIASPAPTQSWSKPPAPPEANSVLAEKFVKAHGRNPNDLNDTVQPNNPQFRPIVNQPSSRVSNTTSKTAKSAGKTVPGSNSLVKHNGNPALNVAPGTILIAQNSAPKASHIHMDVLVNDKIKVLKHVSGITHVGENLRTKERGQFTEIIFKPSSAGAVTRNALEQQRILGAQRGHSKGASSSTVVSNGLDKVEGMNAREWDDVSDISRSRTTAPINKAFGGLGASRFAVLSDNTKSFSSGEKEVVQGVTKEEMSRLFDEKVFPLCVRIHRLLLT